jgi:hypothetical protein
MLYLCSDTLAVSKGGSDFSLAIDSRLKYRRDTSHSSCCSCRIAPARRSTESRLGKFPTTSIRRLISRFRRSNGFVEQICHQCSPGSAMNASTSSPPPPESPSPWESGPSVPPLLFAAAPGAHQLRLSVSDQAVLLLHLRFHVLSKPSIDLDGDYLLRTITWNTVQDIVTNGVNRTVWRSSNTLSNGLDIAECLVRMSVPLNGFWDRVRRIGVNVPPERCASSQADADSQPRQSEPHVHHSPPVVLRLPMSTMHIEFSGIGVQQ